MPKSIISGMKSFVIMLVIAVLITSTYGNQVYAKLAHNTRVISQVFQVQVHMQGIQNR
jgi:hypothetical protein